jgi:RNA polymerase sigma-32 factor
MNDLIPATKNIFDFAFTIPSLNEEEEKELATDYFENGNVESAKKIVLSYLKFVIKIERGLSGYGIDREELVQEGVIGLMKAIKNFDPSMNIRVSTYASDWIRAAMMDYILKNHSSIKTITTKAHKKVFFNINRYRDERGIINDGAREKMSSELGLTLNEVNDSIARLTVRSIGMLTCDADSDDYASGDYELNLASDSDGPEDIVVNSAYEEYQNNNLEKAIETLNEREKNILKKRWLSDTKESLHTLSDKYNISCERVRQLESQAMKRIRKYLEDDCEIVRE